ncbi:HK97 gp10 family phage protein [Sporosarcina trichiuri]|uniref:HK97 gp10 family phage protein n=1 Tax=Sporosarcina trichiuri TaxID=3056445 RepID=UPI0025B45E2B|nr:HK97 gp10 family phage protein [Sporosarcina sp. 0.2-SM1T-5]WJY27473.1 HK97 gp10 family phage protein [Sporosarcina sp. 0.2-SM1T-5]
MGFEFGQVAELRDKVKEFRIASGRVHDKIARRVALLAIRKVKLMTPVDTGDLRNNWQFQVVKKGDVYVIVIFNQVEYASFVESGHRIVVAGRTVGWVEGRFMLKLTMGELESIAPRMWEREIEREMRRIFGQ